MYNNTYHCTIKIKPADVKPSIYIDFDKENNKEDLHPACDIVAMSQLGLI